MAQYRQTFRFPERKLQDGMGGYYDMSVNATQVTYSARTPQQAFRIAQSIAKKNAWTVSGEPVKIN